MRPVLTQLALYHFDECSSESEEIQRAARWGWVRANEVTRAIAEEYGHQWTLHEMLERFLVELWPAANPAIRRHYQLTLFVSNGEAGYRLVIPDSETRRALQRLDRPKIFLVATWVQEVLLYQLNQGVVRLRVEPNPGFIRGIGLKDGKETAIIWSGIQ